jgi:hypothetical protein
MSAIRPPVPSPLFPTQTPSSSPAGTSRSAFFQAALQGATASAAASASTAIAPAPVRDTPVRSIASRAAEGDPTQRLSRPGSLLDIRV